MFTQDDVMLLCCAVLLVIGLLLLAVMRSQKRMRTDAETAALDAHLATFGMQRRTGETNDQVRMRLHMLLAGDRAQDMQIHMPAPKGWDDP